MGRVQAKGARKERKRECEEEVRGRVRTAMNGTEKIAGGGKGEGDAKRKKGARAAR